MPNTILRSLSIAMPQGVPSHPHAAILLLCADFRWYSEGTCDKRHIQLDRNHAQSTFSIKNVFFRDKHTHTADPIWLKLSSKADLYDHASLRYLHYQSNARVAYYVHDIVKSKKNRKKNVSQHLGNIAKSSTMLSATKTS